MNITVDALSFSYAAEQVLREVSFQVAHGEIVCIVGPNGSGKSTLIKCIASLLKKQSGRILFDDVDSERLPPRELAIRIGYMSQAATLCFSTTVFETVLMGRRPHSSWRSTRKDTWVVARILEQMDLEEHALQSVNRLSGGQQQRVFIARALAQEPQALLLDEPTSALDIAHQMDTMDTIRHLARTRRISVIMILHDLNLAARYADRIVMLYEGRVRVQGSPAHAFTPNNMETVYGVRASIQRADGIVSIVPVERSRPRYAQKKYVE
ncbi:ABC transporter ATP-binding protein [Desulfobulbus rhabdoformis]|uniref:ABC transporter ATP-binding protein n=1 Tax=Desulfobulbus rhabdoformis TaxID=34032 RepID=UPI0019645263|nr:ABC transporter ATP-binding protein [Desulfobulbus rhabdoformis]MBM9616734.1 ABC transporter ATP-binding protein [Desulfobulbus rhabdoformis]